MSRLSDPLADAPIAFQNLELACRIATGESNGSENWKLSRPHKAASVCIVPRRTVLWTPSTSASFVLARSTAWARKLSWKRDEVWNAWNCEVLWLSVWLGVRIYANLLQLFTHSFSSGLCSFFLQYRPLTPSIDPNNSEIENKNSMKGCNLDWSYPTAKMGRLRSCGGGFGRASGFGLM